MTVPRMPPKPSSRSGFAGTINKVPKPNEAQTMDQKDAGNVMRRARAPRSLDFFAAPPARVCQLNVMYTRCDNATTNTIVLRFAVKIPIFLPKRDCASSVNRTAVVHVASIPIKSRTDRKISHMVTPNKTSAVSVKYRKSCAMLRRSISTT